MSTTTTNYGLIKPDTTDPILIGQLNDNADVIDATMKSLSDALDVAKLGIKYKGEVNYYSNLPSTGNEIGDAYTVKYSGSSGTTPDGTEYVWGAVSGTNQWINFSKDSYTKAEVDALLSLKANTADIPTPSTVAPAMDGTAAAGTSTDYARADHVHPSDTSKQDALTTSQLAAANSGINSEKVAQYDSTTELEAKDRAALVELVDGGAKNFLPIPSSLGGELANEATIATDGTITITLDAAMESEGSVQWDFPLSAGTFHFSCGENSSMAGVYDCYIRTITSPTTVLRDNSSPPGQVATIASGNYRCYIRMRANAPAGTYVFKPMLCTKAAWDISHEYQPYRPSYQELYERVVALEQANQ